MRSIAKPESHSIRDVAKLLHVRDHTLRHRLVELGAFQPDGITGAARAHPEWIRQGWLVEREQQYRHPHVGPQWYVRVEITPAGIEHLRGLLKERAA